MAPPRRDPAIAAVVRSAMRLLEADLERQTGEKITASAMGLRINRRKDASNISRYRNLGVRPSRAAEKQIARYSPNAGILLEDWIPALRRSMSVRRLCLPLERALRRLGIPEEEITALVSRDTPIHPGGYVRTPINEPLSRVVAELVFLRRFKEPGPIYYSIQQAWHAAAALGDCVVSYPDLRSAALTVWGRMLEFAPSCEDAIRLGQAEDWMPKSYQLGNGIDAVERRRRHSALVNIIQTLLDGEQFEWVEKSLRPDFESIRRKLASAQR